MKKEIKTGHPQTEETRRKISEAMKGRHVSDYVKQRASETHKGKVTSDETKRKMSQAHGKPIKVTDLNTGEEFIFTSQEEAKSRLDIRTQISYIMTVQHGYYKHYLLETE